MENKDLLTERKFWSDYWQGKKKEILQGYHDYLIRVKT